VGYFCQHQINPICENNGTVSTFRRTLTITKVTFSRAELPLLVFQNAAVNDQGWCAEVRVNIFSTRLPVGNTTSNQHDYKMIAG
jgi:hypothetical protein